MNYSILIWHTKSSAVAA